MTIPKIYIIYAAVGVVATLFFVLAVQFLKLFWYEWVLKRSEAIAICPKCHRHVPLRHYRCPDCGRINELIPDGASLYHGRCGCGAILPKTNRFGRAKLVAVCPRCASILGPGAGDLIERVIPIVGGSTVGKSAFLAAWIVTVAHVFPKTFGARVSFPFSGNLPFIETCLRQFRAGIAPNKTHVMEPDGVGVDIRMPEKRKFVRVFCYDPAGECFDETQSLMNFTYYDFMDGILFLIDPFSIPSVRRRYGPLLEGTNQEGFQFSESDIDDYCSRFLISLRKFHDLKMDEYHYAACAVVLTKADMFDLDDQIGQRAARSLRKTSPNMTEDDAMHFACTRFLERAGVGPILGKLNANFSEVRCFSVSAFGHAPETNSAYAPVRIERPFLWLLRQADQRGKSRLFYKPFFAKSDIST